MMIFILCPMGMNFLSREGLDGVYKSPDRQKIEDTFIRFCNVAKSREIVDAFTEKNIFPYGRIAEIGEKIKEGKISLEELNFFYCEMRDLFKQIGMTPKLEMAINKRGNALYGILRILRQYN